MTDKPTKMTEPQIARTTDIADVVNFSVIGNILKDMGIDPSAVKAPTVHYHEKIAWADLCCLDTKDRSTQVSDIVVVTQVSPNIDAPLEFPDYKGMVRVEFVTQMGEKLFVSHAMTYAASGELLPLWQWIEKQSVPFAMRFGRIETRKREQYVIRPMPIDIETV